MEFQKVLKIVADALTGPSYVYRLPLSKNFQDSEAALKNWIEDIRDMNQLFEVMDFKDENTGKTIYELVEEETPNEDILRILESKDFNFFLFDIMKNEDHEDYPEHDDLLEAFRELLTPGRVLEIAKAPFDAEGLTVLCENEKSIIDHEGKYSAVFQHHKALFDVGLNEIAALRFPKGDAVKLAGFMATDETFGTFLDDFCGRHSQHLCNATLPWTVGSLIHNAHPEDEADIKEAFKKKDTLYNAIDIGQQLIKDEEQGPEDPKSQYPSQG